MKKNVEGNNETKKTRELKDRERRGAGRVKINESEGNRFILHLTQSARLVTQMGWSGERAVSCELVGGKRSLDHGNNWMRPT